MIRAIRGDITKIDTVTAIVNAANISLQLIIEYDLLRFLPFRQVYIVFL